MHKIRIDFKMTNKINKEMTIAQAMEENENTAKILFEEGIGCVGCMMAHAESLEDGLAGHGLSKEEIGMIIEKINSEE
jgi:hybrid cluster-associated redox disulfide protein